MSTIISTTTYKYDKAHNRVQKVKDGKTTDYTYNELNQLTEFTEGQRRVVFIYDANGNRIRRIEGGIEDIYGYDYENRLVSLRKGGVPYGYTYDYRTRRVERVEGSTSTKVVFSGGTSVQEYEGPNLIVEYIRGSDLGGGIGGILYTLRNNQPSYTHYNNRGDVVAKTNASQALTYQASYEAFGTRTQEVGQTKDRQKANTKDEDPTGLLNEGFRYRDLETGNFITRDPLGFKEGPNFYTYVHQNPWTKFDPEGLQTLRYDEVGVPWLAGSPTNLKAEAREMQMGYREASDPNIKKMSEGIRSLEKGDVYVYRGHAAEAFRGEPAIAAAGKAPKGEASATIDIPTLIGGKETVPATAYPIPRMVNDLSKAKGIPAAMVFVGCELSARDMRTITDVGVSVAITSSGHGDISWAKAEIHALVGALASGKTVDQALAAANVIVRKENENPLSLLGDVNRGFFTASFAKGLDGKSTLKDIRKQNDRINAQRQAEKKKHED